MEAQRPKRKAKKKERQKEGKAVPRAVDSRAASSRSVSAIPQDGACAAALLEEPQVVEQPESPERKGEDQIAVAGLSDSTEVQSGSVADASIVPEDETAADKSSATTVPKAETISETAGELLSKQDDAQMPAGEASEGTVMKDNDMKNVTQEAATVLSKQEGDTVVSVEEDLPADLSSHDISERTVPEETPLAELAAGVAAKSVVEEQAVVLPEKQPSAEHFPATGSAVQDGEAEAGLSTGQVLNNPEQSSANVERASSAENLCEEGAAPLVSEVCAEQEARQAAASSVGWESASEPVHAQVLLHDSDATAVPVKRVAAVGHVTLEATAPAFVDPLSRPEVTHAMPTELTHMPMMRPLSEEELSALYHNPLLYHNDAFVDDFLRICRQERHPFFELISNYLRHRLALSNIDKDIEALHRDYVRNVQTVWIFEEMSIIGEGRCRDHQNVSYAHYFKQARFQESTSTEMARHLKNLRLTSHEARSLAVYEAQLAWLHVEQYLFKLISGSATLAAVQTDSPITAWAVVTQAEDIVLLRNCISVLFAFERRPIADEVFVQHLRAWTERLVAVLLRVATLNDHLFLLNHIMRCPAGVARWATSYIQVLPPQSLEQQGSMLHPTGVMVSYSHYSQPLMDLFVTLLATLLQPIKEREEFLSALNIPDTPQSPQPNSIAFLKQTWTLIDEDGEDVEDESPTQYRLLLREADYTAIFEQLPFTDMFKYILRIHTVNGEVHYQIQFTTSHDMLTLFAFASRLLYLLAGAFQTLTQARFRQFNKRVGRTIRVMVQFLADHWMAYTDYRRDRCAQQWEAMPHESVPYGTPRHSLQRLQLEFDQFFLRALQYILVTQRVARWQVVSDMPFACLSPDMLWQVFYLLHNLPDDSQGKDSIAQNLNKVAVELAGITASNCRQELLEPQRREVFIVSLQRMNPGEAIFLLTTFANMARSCRSDLQFVEAVALEIFELGYLTGVVKDFLHRPARDLLDSVCLAHPFVISVLLRQVHQTIAAMGQDALALFNTLPLRLWKPSDADIQLLQDWLLGLHPDDLLNQLSRRTLAQMDWSTVEENGEVKLALASDLHRRVAVLVTEAQSQWVPSTEAKTSLAAENYNFHQTLNWQQQQHLTEWSWRVVLSLRLHARERPLGIKQPQESSGAAAVTAAVGEEEVPELFGNPDFLVVERLLSSSPLAMYVALASTVIGHREDEFLKRGLLMLSQIATAGVPQPVVRVLSNCLPIFFRKKESLLNHPVLTGILQSLLMYDQQPASLAEKYVFGTFNVGETTKQMAGTIQTHLDWPAPEEVEIVVSFWLDLLLSMSDWNQNPCVLYLLDKLVKLTFRMPACQTIIHDTLTRPYEFSMKAPRKQGLLSSLITFVSRSAEPGCLLDTKLWPAGTWFSYAVLCVEEDCEVAWGVRDQLLSCLRANRNSTVDTALAEALPHARCPSKTFPSWRLAIYRWAQLALAIDEAHCLLPLIFQHFFRLFLERRKSSDNELPNLTPCCSEGQRFFESYTDGSTLRSLKKRLFALSKRHSTSAAQAARADASPSDGNAVKDESQTCTRSSLLEGHDSDEPVLGSAVFHDQLSRMYQTMGLWLEEPRLHDSTLQLASLPPQYEPDRLQEIFCGRNTLWLDLLNDDALKSQGEELFRHWLSLSYTPLASAGPNPTIARAALLRRLGSTSAGASDAVEDPAMRILKRLERYRETPLPPPAVSTLQDPTPSVSQGSLHNGDLLLSELRPDFDMIKDTAKSFHERVSQHTALDVQYLDNVRYLYANNPTELTQNVVCQSRFNPAHRCRGAAVIHLQFREAKIQEPVQRRLEQNRTSFKELLSEARSSLPQPLCVAVVRVESAITDLVHMARRGESAEAAIPLFYSMAHLIDDIMKFFPPSRQFFVACIDMLGQEFISSSPHQSQQLLSTMLSTPALTPHLSSLFLPTNSPDMFCDLYGQVTAHMSERSEHAFSLLTKFEVQRWLNDHRPLLSDRSKLVAAVGEALCVCGGNEVLSALMHSHFRQLFLYRFPEHYSDVLTVLLKGSESGRLSVSVWLLVLECIGCSLNTDTLSKISTPPTACKQLSPEQVKETITFLSSHFSRLRAKELSSSAADNGREGQLSLYATWQLYLPAVGGFMTFLLKSHIDNICAELAQRSLLSFEEAIRTSWQATVSLFDPWIHCQAAVQSAPSRNLIPAFHENEKVHAADMFGMFIDVVLHSQQSFPAAVGSGRDALSLLWQHYERTLSARGTPGYVLRVYHSCLESLSWSDWVPTLQAVEAMMELKNDHPRESFVFLGCLVPLVPWEAVIEKYDAASSSGLATQTSLSAHLHSNLLLLISMLCFDPTIMREQGAKLSALVEKAMTFHWQHLSVSGFFTTVQWLAKEGSLAAVLNRTSNLHLILRLLYWAAEFPKEKSEANKEASEKRFSYLNFITTNVVNCSHQPQLGSHLYPPVVTMVMAQTEMTLTKDSSQGQSLLPLVFTILDGSSSNPGVSAVVLQTILAMLTSSPVMQSNEFPSPRPDFFLMYASAACRTLNRAQDLIEVIEHCISEHFSSLSRLPAASQVPDSSSVAGWRPVLAAVSVPDHLSRVFINTAVQEGAILSLYADLMQRLPLCQSLLQELAIANTVLDWVGRVKLTPQNDKKVVLLYVKLVELILRQVSYGTPPSSIAPLISSLSPIIFRVSEDKASDGLLGILGLGKKSQLNMRFRLFGRALAAFLICQVPGGGNLRTVPMAPGHPLVKVPGQSSPMTDAQRFFNSLESLGKNRAYVGINHIVPEMCNFAMDPQFCLMDAMRVVSRLVQTLFADERYLAVLLLQHA